MRRSLRRWVGDLHGGQLLMLLMLVAFVGLSILWIGYNVYVLPANSTPT
jgi:hypothetical protein